MGSDLARIVILRYTWLPGNSFKALAHMALRALDKPTDDRPARLFWGRNGLAVALGHEVDSSTGRERISTAAETAVKRALRPLIASGAITGLHDARTGTSQTYRLDISVEGSDLHRRMWEARSRSKTDPQTQDRSGSKSDPPWGSKTDPNSGPKTDRESRSKTDPPRNGVEESTTSHFDDSTSTSSTEVQTPCATTHGGFVYPHMFVAGEIGEDCVDCGLAENHAKHAPGRLAS